MVMVGAPPITSPGTFWGEADRLWDETPPFADPVEAAAAMRPRIAAHLAQGGRLHQMTGHAGPVSWSPRARGWRRQVSEAPRRATDTASALAVYDAALAEVITRPDRRPIAQTARQRLPHGLAAVSDRPPAPLTPIMKPQDRHLIRAHQPGRWRQCGNPARRCCSASRRAPRVRGGFPARPAAAMSCDWDARAGAGCRAQSGAGG